MVYYCGVTSEFITDEKNLGPTIGGASQSDRNRDGVDRDGDGVINDGTEDERPAKKKKRDERRDYAPRTNEPPRPRNERRDERRDGPWMNEAPLPQRPSQNTPPARPIPNNRGTTPPARPIPNNRGTTPPARPIPNNPIPKKKKQTIYSDGRRYSRSLMPEGSDPSDYPTDKYELVNPDGTPYKGEKSLESDVVLRIDIKALGGSIGRRVPSRPNVGKNPKDGDGDGFIVDLTTGLDNVPFKPLKPIDGSGRDKPPVPRKLTAAETRALKEKVKKRKLFPDRSDDELLQDWKDTKPYIPSGGRVGMNPLIEDEKRKKRIEIEKEMNHRGIMTPDVERMLTPSAEDMARLAEQAANSGRIDGDTGRGARARTARRWADYVARGGKQTQAEWARGDRSRNPNDYAPDNQFQARRLERDFFLDGGTRVRPIDGSGRDRNTVSIDLSQFDLATGKRKPTPKKPDAEEKPKLTLLPKPAKKDPDNRWDDAETEEIFKQMDRETPLLNKLRAYVLGDKPERTLPSGYQRGRGQTAESHSAMVRRTYQDLLANQKAMRESLKKRGYEDAEQARIEYNRSKKAKKSLSPFDMLSDDNASISVVFTEE